MVPNSNGNGFFQIFFLSLKKKADDAIRRPLFVAVSSAPFNWKFEVISFKSRPQTFDFFALLLNFCCLCFDNFRAAIRQSDRVTFVGNVLLAKRAANKYK